MRASMQYKWTKCKQTLLLLRPPLPGVWLDISLECATKHCTPRKVCWQKKRSPFWETQAKIHSVLLWDSYSAGVGKHNNPEIFGTICHGNCLLRIKLTFAEHKIDVATFVFQSLCFSNPKLKQKNTKQKHCCGCMWIFAAWYLCVCVCVCTRVHC